MCLGGHRLFSVCLGRQVTLEFLNQSRTLVYAWILFSIIGLIFIPSLADAQTISNTIPQTDGDDDTSPSRTESQSYDHAALNRLRQACPIVVVNGQSNLAPISSRSDSGALVGLGPNILSKALGRLGFQIIHEHARPLRRQIRDLQSGDVHIIAGADPAQFRLETLRATRPFFNDTLYAYTKTDRNIHVETVEDLGHWRGGYIIGPGNGDEFARFVMPMLSVHGFSKVASAVELLVRDRLDYIVLTRHALKHDPNRSLGLSSEHVIDHLPHDGGSLALKRIGPPLGGARLRFLVTSAPPCSDLLTFLNAQLNIMEQNKTLQALEAVHLLGE